ncbi:hypothetical protein CROQUDRAFT_101804 [Cronartium quercuum f. sp. fusiforme G11]|uniref:Uncharacterized protein n=1 Tax=Cronartium quercuum f. sp. fusiforme G11 TaxID=708437 RepID=A0A9P6T4Z9_9BASI|nr:hypothetical protein CROQUDRAFT_101804 [Cronartium quercuum f. sp. fusiforme G11]
MVPSLSQTVAATLDMKVPHASEFSTSSNSNDNNNQATPHQNQHLVGIKKTMSGSNGGEQSHQSTAFGEGLGKFTV